MKEKTRPSQKSRIPKCPRCGRREWRRKGLQPTNPTGHSAKGFHGKHHERYFQESQDRLYTKVYVCKHCNKKINYGNAGRPII